MLLSKALSQGTHKVKEVRRTEGVTELSYPRRRPNMRLTQCPGEDAFQCLNGSPYLSLQVVDLDKMHYKNALLHYELKWTIKTNYLDKKNCNENLLISYLDCFWICLLWLMSSCWSGTFKSPLINSHFGTGRLLFGLGVAKLTHGDAVPEHDTNELLLYTVYVRLSQNCSSSAHAALLLVAQFITIEETVMARPSQAKLNRMLICSRHLSRSQMLLFSFVPKAKWHRYHPSTLSLDKLEAWNSRKKTSSSNCFCTSLHRSLLRLRTFWRQRLLG